MKRLLAAMTAALMMVALVSSTVFAVAPTTDLMGQAWKVYNVKPATSSYWDINKVKLTNGTLQFPIQQFDTPATGSFAVYLLDNYNVSLKTSQTLSATMNWTAGTYETRSTVYPGAYVRFEFQDVTAGPYTASDYWWSTASLDLNVVPVSNTLSVSLANCALWTNMDGISACVDTVGFANAMKNVKQLGLSFGSSGTYASGVALDDGTGTFTVLAFTVAP